MLGPFHSARLGLSRYSFRFLGLSVTIEYLGKDNMQNSEDGIYTAIAAELETGNTDKGLWTRLYAKCGGDERETKVLYIKERAERLMSSELAKPITATSKFTEATVVQQSAASEADLMHQYGIAVDGDRYAYQGYRYDHLSDAIAYASRARGQEQRIEAGHVPVSIASESKSDQLYRTFVGANKSAYYSNKFNQFDAQNAGLRASWNWSAFFCTGAWVLYRKMYGWFFVSLLVIVVGQMLEKTGSEGLSALTFLGAAIAFGVYGNSIYHGKAKTKIEAAKRTTKNEKQLLELLSYEGGVHAWVIWVFGGLPLVGVAAAIFLPMFAGS